MKSSENPEVIYLKPGEFYWGEQNIRINTLLGSCVALCFWHPRLYIGGMCHYMLPRRLRGEARTPDGRYAEEAMQMFLQKIAAAGTYPEEYQIKAFGAAFMMASLGGENDVAERNRKKAYEIIRKYNLDLRSENMGSRRYRRIQFDLWSGVVWMKLQALQNEET